MKANGIVQKTSLTPYKSGSFLELWTVSWPLMLASFSGNLMVFLDRLIVSHYSSEAFVACTAAQPWYWTIECTLMSVIIITEVFIGRYNGAGDYKKIGPLIWQMLVCAFACEIILIPVILSVHYLLADNIEALAKPYLQILLVGCPFELAGFGVIGSFFVGRGETKCMPVISLISNMINILLDVWFVFGGCGIPSMGIYGAALATVIAQGVGFCIFLCLFLRPRYHSRFLTNQFQWSWSTLGRIIRIGGANAMASFCQMFGWAIAYQFLALNSSTACFMAYSAASTFYLLVFFVVDGLGKGVGVICSNFIGAGQLHLFGKLFRQVISMCGYFMGAALLLILLGADKLVQFIVDQKYYAEVDFRHSFHLFLTWEWVLFGCDIIVYSIQNFLIALTKTKVVLFFQVVVAWSLVLLPTYFLIKKCQFHPVVYLQLKSVEAFLCMIVFSLWYRRRSWARGLKASL